jgi:hypothetical protein
MLAVAIQATQSIACGVLPCTMELEKQLIRATKSLVTGARRRSQMAWVTAAGIRASSVQSQARISETIFRLHRTDTLLEELERQLPGSSHGR